MLIAARHHYYPTLPWIWDKLSCKTSALLKFEILGLFVNTLTADDKYSRQNVQNFQQQLQTALSQKQKIFPVTFIAFIKATSNLEHFEKKKMSLLVSVFPKLLTQKEMVTWTSKTVCFRTPFCNQRVHEFQTLSKSARHHYYPIVPWIWDKLSWKKCSLVRFEILRLFVNTLTTDDKYSSGNIQNLTQQLQTAISQNQKTFSGNFITYLKSRTNSDDFVEKNESPSLTISEIIDAEESGYLNV